MCLPVNFHHSRYCATPATRSWLRVYRLATTERTGCGVWPNWAGPQRFKWYAPSKVGRSGSSGVWSNWTIPGVLEGAHKEHFLKNFAKAKDGKHYLSVPKATVGAEGVNTTWSYEDMRRLTQKVGKSTLVLVPKAAGCGTRHSNILPSVERRALTTMRLSGGHRLSATS